MNWVLRKTERALDDLADIWNYIALDYSPATEKLITDLLALFEKTADYPMIGRSADEIAAGHRILTHGRYLLIYCVHEDRRALELIRVIHGARNWPNLFDG